MYQLTVDVAGECTVTEHPHRDDAHGRLMRDVIAGDYYLHTVQARVDHSTYELLTVDRDPRRPRSAGHAKIESVDPLHRPTVDPPRIAAVAARAWIARHRHAWRHGRDTDPAGGHAVAVLTIARAEARAWLPAGTLLPEAARLAGVANAPAVSTRRLEILRRSAVESQALMGVRIAEAVVSAAAEHTPDSTLAALVWWRALLGWGATAP